MAESNRKKILDAAVKAILSASDTAWWLKGPATFIAELSPKFHDLPEEQKEALTSVSLEEFVEVIEQQLYQSIETHESVERIEALVHSLRDDVTRAQDAVVSNFETRLAAALETVVASSRRPAEAASARTGESTMDDRISFTDRLSHLSEPDFARLLTAISGAANRVTKHASIPERSAELIAWAESPTGCGLARLQNTYEQLF